MLFFELESSIYQNSSCNYENTVILTIPKSGTYLLGKTIEMISKGQLKTGKILHLTPELITSTIWKDEIKKVLLIRDPRDILISKVFWIMGKNYFWPPNTHIDIQFNQLSFGDQLNWVINFPEENCGVREYVKMALEWKKDPNVFVCRFEDLVGPKGGGNRLQQEKTITDLAEYLGYSLSFEEVVDIADHLFGGTDTFRRGKIGLWKRYFSSQHKALFKHVMGNELIELGYSDSDNW